MGKRKHVEAEKKKKAKCQACLERNLKLRKERKTLNERKPRPGKRPKEGMGKDIAELMATLWRKWEVRAAKAEGRPIIND